MIVCQNGASHEWGGGFTEITDRVEKCRYRDRAILCSDQKVVIDKVLCVFYCNRSCESPEKEGKATKKRAKQL